MMSVGYKGYRCYYYDTETGFYYLNSRYYDPQIRRFISADNITTNVGENTKGYNLYSYCQDAPVGKADYDGHCPIALVAGVSLTVGQFLAITGVIIFTYMVIDYAMNPDSRENPVAVICNTISDQVVSIRNAKKNKNGEKTGKNGLNVGQNGVGNVTQGKSRAPKTGTPGSVYEQVDENGNVMSRTKYGDNGKPEYRDD